MTKDEAADGASPRLGWLEAYVAAAQHLSYERAARDVGVHASNVQRNVDRLQVWLHRIVMLDGMPLQLPPDDGMPAFLPVAMEVLSVFAKVRAKGTLGRTSGSFSKSKRSIVRLVDLQTILDMRRYESIDATASHLGCSYKTVRSRISTVEDALGGKVFYGRSRLSVSQIGANLVPAAQKIIELMEGARADVSGYDPFRLYCERLRRRAWRRRVELSAYITQIGHPRSNVERIRMNDAKASLAVIEKVLAELSPEGNARPCEVDVTKLDLQLL